jgi:hypothetical protein
VLQALTASADARMTSSCFFIDFSPGKRDCGAQAAALQWLQAAARRAARLFDERTDKGA